jgi:hypothetical protein
VGVFPLSGWNMRKRGGFFHPAGYSNAEAEDYTSPWSSMALATFRKPPMLAPFTRLPGVP